jgi:hypothetical protein
MANGAARLNHFPDLAALLPACTAHSMAQQPRPDLAAAFALDDPAERLRAALTPRYGWHRRTASMQARVLGERSSVPELDAWMARSADVTLAQPADDLAAGFAREPARALVAVGSTSGRGSGRTARDSTTPPPRR